jgi:cytochrome b subunit of formate dehydrogenase
MSIKDLLLLAKATKYIIIFCFVILLYSGVSISFILGRQIDWAELAYVCAVNIPALWIMIKIEKYLQSRNSLCN